MNRNDIERLEIELLISAIEKRYGYDFSHYARSSFHRRVCNRLNSTDLTEISELIPRLLRDEDFFDETLKGFSITVTEMFRDAEFYRDIKKLVIPKLKTYPFLKIWHAGCATGEEVYSMAIVLHEEGLLKKAQIYATDFNNTALKKAERGIYSLRDIPKFDENYKKSGGKKQLSDYFHSQYQSAKMDKFLSENITFANHNLVTDGVFGEMHLIVCRNVMIYFDRTLQNRVYSLFVDSLIHRGFLCLGSKDTVSFSDVGDNFETLTNKNRIFQLLAPVTTNKKVTMSHV